MAAAIALAVVLVIAVGGVSLAMQTQRPVQGQAPRTPRPQPRGPAVSGRIRPRKPTPRAAPTPPPEPTPPPTSLVPEGSKGPELLRTGVPASAKVVNVVDERVVGPVTRSRLTLRIEPDGADPFEVDLRHAFPSTEARGKVKIGGTVAVRYDKDHPKKVVIDPGAD